MAEIERYRKLVLDLRNEPMRYFDHLSPLDLHVFIQGYQHGDQGLCVHVSRAHENVVSEHKVNLSIGLGSIMYAFYDLDAVGYEGYIVALSRAIAQAPDTDQEAGPTHTSVQEFLPVLKERPAMLFGNNDVRSWRIFLSGFLRALDDTGLDTSQDRQRLKRFEARLRSETHLVGRWDRILTAQSMGSTMSIQRFVEYFEGNFE